jgi:phosphoserine aminotransferase
MFDYKVFSDSNSCYNTPPVFNIYVTGLVFKHLLSTGMELISCTNYQKSQLVYDMIKKYPKVYSCPVVSECYKSRMNIPFRVLEIGNSSFSKQREELFLNKAGKLGMIGLNGHRSVGGVRVSIYNAMDIDGVKILVKLMETFAKGEYNL